MFLLSTADTLYDEPAGAIGTLCEDNHVGRYVYKHQLYTSSQPLKPFIFYFKTFLCLGECVANLMSEAKNHGPGFDVPQHQQISFHVHSR